MSGISRREMLSGLAGTLGVAALPQVNLGAGQIFADRGDYLLQPGLIYLNTGSLGPTPRSENTQKNTALKVSKPRRIACL